MEFGLFAQLFVPYYERNIDPMAEHKRIMRNVEVGVAASTLALGPGLLASLDTTSLPHLGSVLLARPETRHTNRTGLVA